jgi:hypothetical protein
MFFDSTAFVDDQLRMNGLLIVMAINKEKGGEGLLGVK